MDVAYEILKYPSKPKADPWTTATKASSSNFSTKSLSVFNFVPNNFLQLVKLKSLKIELWQWTESVNHMPWLVGE